jgi:hypothetical protein
MEIHHHPHSPRKSSHTIYMNSLCFFLAVTASFCVENLREYYVEQQRARQFAGLLVADLRKTLSFIRERINCL